MYHVLMAVDTNEEQISKQLDSIRELPGREEVSVTVLYVHEEVDAPPDEAGKRVIESVNEELEAVQGTPDAVQRARDELRESGIEAEISTTRGDPAEAILEVGEETDPDAICVAGHKRSPVGKAVFGSVTQSVVLESDRTVIVAG